MAGRLAGVLAAYDRYMDCRGCPKFGPAHVRGVRCPTGHRPGIDRFIGDQIAMKNAAPEIPRNLSQVTHKPIAS